MPQKMLRAVGAIAASIALLLAAGCASTATPQAQPGQLRVVVAFYPFQYIAERVGGTDAVVTNLTQPGAEPHDLELTPRQVASLSDADLVIYQQGFQPAVDKAIEQAKPRRTVDVAQVVSLRTTAQEEAHGAESEPGHDHDHGTGGDELDPHAWLDPTNLVTVSQAVSRALADAKPERAATFEQHAKAAEADLTALDQEFQRGLAECVRRDFITSHAAFGYLAERYRLTQIGIRGLSAEAEPSPARIAEVQQIAREHGITTIFYETLVSPAVANAVAGDLGLRTDVLDPLEGLTDRSRGDNYIEVMRSNLNSLKEANGCR
ncbi:zinc ABC transporter substrate-binding protein [Enemella evansiae]|uniref:metal ABC transporter substrate-binding protein n=1 Tax=Enemella evansiae TaxID=2016499 RepID=UPI000B96C9D0|nr:metal ABC transporter substrate-binding protein [Enemella evansiae]OYN93811.1 zinc ABC transporter substrate-binding protein [Enemella evansiae]